ncbi:large conductance mechanosensitive channel protein MscL [Leucobacter weissii]|uniref:Large-conductance mechanosensitive channel n=1 Tax=Leucobacter weissii TaxID=1983706 RepID=A0A939MIR8_9MICO|nr:large conductance mechanosensitive channel protein MscL [Leucobacter weissii]MBO1900765.1 large conductance mechanosensitive channel protein MscL [Leucobacter weissii]
MKGFKEFIMRGNVIELAVAVIIGAAFTSIVNALVDGIFNPLIAAIFNADEINKAVWQIGPVSLGVGAVLGALINFLLIALVVYFVIILPMNKLNEAAYVRKHGHKPEDEEEPPTETDLLVEIRDLLAQRETGGAPEQRPAVRGEGPAHGAHGAQ